jgi:hypothetical protein
MRPHCRIGFAVSRFRVSYDKRKGVIMGNKNKAKQQLGWHEKTTMCLQLMRSCTRLTVAISVLIHVVVNHRLL